MSSPIYLSGDVYETLISQMVTIEKQKQLTIKEQKSEVERFKGVLKDFDSTVSALHTQLKTLLDTVTNPFSAKAATIPSNTSFSAKASDGASVGSHSINVIRTAAADTRVSKQFTKTGTTLSDYFDQNGPQTFSIDVAHPTEEDPDNRVSVSVTIDPEGTDDASILKEISEAINTAMDQAVDDGDLLSKEAVKVSVINESSGVARLSVRAGQTGYSNRLSFTDSDDTLLGQLDLLRNQVSSGTAGGQIVSVGTSETDSLLNAKFTLDGLTLYRSTNTVTDALDGVTLTLKKADTETYDFSVGSDSDNIKGVVNSFISKYNAVLKYIAGKSTVNGETGERGDFAGESAFTSLRYNMRNDMAKAVTGLSASAPKSLAEIGITIEKDGTLTLKEESKLISAIQTDASAVQQLFTSSDGFANRLKTRLDIFVGGEGKTGIIDQRVKVADDRINRLSDSIADWDDKLAKYEEDLRLKFARFQEAVSTLQGQQTYFNSLLSY